MGGHNSKVLCTTKRSIWQPLFALDVYGRDLCTTKRSNLTSRSKLPTLPPPTMRSAINGAIFLCRQLVESHLAKQAANPTATDNESGSYCGLLDDDVAPRFDEIVLEHQDALLEEG